MQVEQRQHLVDTFEHGGSVQSKRGRTECDFLLGGGAEDLMVGILEDESDVGRHFADAVFGGVEPIHRHRALRGSDQSVQVFGECGLAGAVTSDESDE